MNTLLIEKQTGGYFKFTLNGDTANAITSINNDLLAVGNQLHFKTGNGANIIKEQFIYPADVTIVSGGTFTFTTVAQVWDKLIAIDYFAWLGGGSTGGVDRFDDLLDTFSYTGNAGKAVVVDNSELKLVPITLYNKRLFTELEDTPNSLVPDKMVVVNSTGTALIFQDQPEPPAEYLNSVGYFDYNDLATQTTPLNAVANVALKLTNDTEGANTSTDQNPYGVSYVWDYTTNQFNFSELEVGDTIDVRVHVQVTTTTSNQKVSLSAKFGIGSVAEFTNSIFETTFKTSGLHEISFVAPFYMGSTDITDYPAELYLTTDASATVKVDGWYVRILRKNINIITVDYQVEDATTTTKGIVRLAGDLAGTANNPTVPELANKVPTSRTVSTTSPLLGGGALSSNLTLSIQQSNSVDSGYLSNVDWITFNGKANDNAVVKLTGDQSIAGDKTFTTTNRTTFQNGDAAQITFKNTGDLTKTLNIGYGSNGNIISSTGLDFRVGGLTSSALLIASNENATFKENLTAKSFIKSGGTSSQFLKADGSIDSTTYQTALTNPVTGTGTTNYLPKFTGSSAIGNSLIFDNGTNVGIGTASPLTALTVSGNLSLFTTNQIRLYNSAKNNWAEMSSPLLGGDTEIDFKLVTKSGVVYVNPTGSVGIGTTSPATLLTISSLAPTFTINRQPTGTQPKISLTDNGSEFSYIQSSAASSTMRYDIGPSAGWGGIHAFYTDTTEKMRITSGGSVGIGTTSPSEKLEVQNGASGAKIKVSNSGGGYAMLECSSNATSTATLSFTNSLNLSGGNVGIGTTSPNQKLDVNGDISSGGTGINGSFKLKRTSDGAVINEISYVSATDELRLNNGSGSGNITFLTTSTERMRITSGGNVGIGTTSPSYILQTKASSGFVGAAFSSSYAATSIIGNDANSSWFGQGTNGLGSAYVINNTSGYAQIELGGSPRFYVNSSGNVGIGTTNPSQKLEVSGGAVQFNGGGIDATLGDAILFGNTTYPTVQKNRIRSSISATGANNLLVLETSTATTGSYNNNQLVLKGDGNVGIGTTSPSTKLSVSDAITYGIYGPNKAVINAINTTTDGTAGFISLVGHSGNTSTPYGWGGIGGGKMTAVGNGEYGGYLSLWTTSNGENGQAASASYERMRITSGGDVFIGATSAANVEKLGVTYNSQDRLGFVLNDTYTGAGGAQIAIQFRRNGSAIGSITTTTTTTSYNITSDYRLKEDFRNYSGLDLISKIKTYDYKWKKSEDRMFGVKAHELQEVIPYAVTGEKDAEQMQSVDYSKLVPILVQAIQELKAEIEILKNK